MRILLLFALLTSALSAAAITVDEAYQAIPHAQTQYTPSESPLPEELKNYLRTLFNLSDRALVARIEMLQALSKGSGTSSGNYEERVDRIVAELNDLAEPGLAQGLKGILIRAINEQRSFFRAWNNALATGRSFKFPSGETGNGVHPSISAASQQLHHLYGELTSRFSQETPHNRQAFFDHLCALDFI